MSTISKIPMSGYVPITNKKLNQKASNPISANNSNSRDLMSPNAHYAKHAVSFKARMSPQEAEVFIRDFSFTPPAVDTWERTIKSGFQSKIKTLLNTMAYQDLKPGALNHLSNLLTHDNTAVRGFTLDYISKSDVTKLKVMKTIIPDLIDPIKRCLGMQEHSNVRNKGLHAIIKFVPINPDAVATPELINGPILHTIIRDETEEQDRNRYLAFKVLNECVKAKPQIAPDVIINYVSQALNDNNPSKRICALKTLGTCIKVSPEFLNYVIAIDGPIAVRLNPQIEQEGSVRTAAFKAFKKCITVVPPQNIPAIINHPIITNSLASNDSMARDYALWALVKCVETNHVVMPEVINNHIIPRLNPQNENDSFACLPALDALVKCVEINPAIMHEAINDHISSCLASPYENVCNKALDALVKCVKIDPKIAPQIVNNYICRDFASPNNRNTALRALGECIKMDHELATPQLMNHISQHINIEQEPDLYTRNEALKLISQCVKINHRLATPQLINSVRLNRSYESKLERKTAISVYNNLVPILEKRQRHAFLSAMGVRNIPHTDENIKSHIFSFVKERLAPLPPAPRTNVQ